MLKTLPLAFGLLATTALVSCAASQKPATLTTIATDELITREAVKNAFAPVLISRADQLTEGTFTAIRDHNTVYWCLFPETAPEAFEGEACAGVGGLP